MTSRVNGTRAKEVLKARGAAKTKAIPIRKSRDALTGSSASGSKSRFQQAKDFLARVGSSQNAENATPEESTTSTADTDLQQGLSHSAGSSDDKQPTRNVVEAVSDAVLTFLQRTSEPCKHLYRMQPEVRWLNQQSNRFLTIDSENYSLYELNDQDRTEYRCDLVATCSVSAFGPRQDQETIRCYALDNSRDNNIALGFSNGRIQLARADIDSTEKVLKGDEIRDTQKAISCMSWSMYEPKLAAAYERGRAIDHTVVVYDVPRNARTRDIPLPTYELSVTDKVFGLAWFTDDPNVLAISSTKQLRFADIRDRNIATSIPVSLPALGVCTEPNLGFRFAFHSRNVVTTYDRRFMDKPVYEIPVGSESQTINQLAWQPRKLYSLSCTLSNSGVLHDLSISRDAYCFDDHLDRNSNPIESKQAVDDVSAQFKHADLYESVPGIDKLVSFHWHPSQENVLVAMSAAPPSTVGGSTTKGSVELKVAKINRKVNCALSACSDLAIAYSPYVNIVHKPTGDEARHVKTRSSSSEETDQNFAPDYNSLAPYATTKDLGWIIRDRAERGYGYVTGTTDLGPVIKTAVDVIESEEDADEDLKFCWAWIQRMHGSPEIQKLRSSYHTSFPGAQHVVKDIKSISSVRQDDVTYRNRVFTNEKRDHILRLCGWPVFNDGAAFKDMFEALMERGTELDMARAAALAMFSVQGWLCKEYLSRLCDYTRSEKFTRKHPNDYVREYQRMATDVYNALLSFDGIKVKDYEGLCATVNDHYLLAIVKFLARREGYNIIHNEIIALQDLVLEDKLAFAAIHMDDESLHLALAKLMEDLGNERRFLTVLTITGLDDCEECHRALQNYVEHTMDVQTATLLLAVGNCFRGSHAFRSQASTGARIGNLLTDAYKAEKKETPRARSIDIVAEYIRLLDVWCMWNHRTFISHLIRGPKPGTEYDFRTKPMINQAVVACAYCGVPIYPSISEKTESLRPQQAGKTLFSNFQRRGGRARMMQCSNCRKPLPKCTICRRHMGSQLEPNEPNSSVDHWFVWCCGCNHGGHLAHIRQWFSEYATCPASGCACLCMERDYRLKDDVQQIRTIENATIFAVSQHVEPRDEPAAQRLLANQ